DLVIGKADGKLAYYENSANVNSPATFTASISDLKDNNGQTITAGTFAFPQLFDLNKDGKLDLIIGRKTGRIMYYENIGTSTIPSFKLISTNLGNLDISIVSPEGYAAPHFFRHNDTTHLFVGAFDGKLHYYKNIDNR